MAGALMAGGGKCLRASMVARLQCQSGVPTICRAQRPTMMCSGLGHATRPGAVAMDPSRPGPGHQTDGMGYVHLEKNLRRMPSNTINSNKSWKDLRLRKDPVQWTSGGGGVLLPSCADDGSEKSSRARLTADGRLTPIGS
jgi:hypothetical protein